MIRTRKTTSLLLLGSAMVLLAVVGGCGNSTHSVVPEAPDNPYAEAKVGTDSTLEVMTWNLEHFAKNTNTTSSQVTLALQALEADIIGLQEIENATQFQKVVDGLDGWAGYRANSAGYSVNLAYLYRTDGLLVVDSIQEIMTSASAPFPRNPLLLLGSFDGKPIAVINNHLKCCGDGYIDENDSWDEETRRRDACLMLEDYVLTNLAGRHVFLIGDFNDELTDRDDRNVFANFLGDPALWRAVDLPIAEGPSGGWSFPGWPSHLDHIIIDQSLFAAADGPEAEVQVVPLFAFMPGGWPSYDRDISDHLPVIIKLKP